MKPEEFDIRIVAIEELHRLSSINRWELVRHGSDGAKVDSAVSVGFDSDTQSDDTVALRLGVRYRSMRAGLMRPLLTYYIRVEFRVTDLVHRVMVTDTAVYLSTGLLSLMLSASVGALRGMLALRTSGTFLARHPLPLLSIAELLEHIKGDNDVVSA